jgi:hypothetical protein
MSATQESRCRSVEYDRLAGHPPADHIEDQPIASWPSLAPDGTPAGTNRCPASRGWFSGHSLSSIGVRGR